MSRAKTILASILATVAQAQAYDFDTNVRQQKMASDEINARRDQAESLRSMERMQRERFRQDRQNAERDSGSMRRFDR